MRICIELSPILTIFLIFALLPLQGSGGDKDKDKAAGEKGGFVAGEHIVIRPQVRDQFGNPSTAAEGTLTLETAPNR